MEFIYKMSVVIDASIAEIAEFAANNGIPYQIHKLHDIALETNCVQRIMDIVSCLIQFLVIKRCPGR